MKRFISLCLCLWGIAVQAQPALKWLSYYGGKETNTSTVHYDSINKCIYIAGAVGDTSGIATPGSFKDTYTQTYSIPAVSGREFDAFLSKWDLNGNLQWATYYGGAAMEHSARVKTDKWGNVYILGYTESDTGIVSSEAYLSEFVATSHYLAKFSPDGNRLWATYLSVSDTMTVSEVLYTGYRIGVNSYAHQLDIDTEGNVYAAFLTGLDKEIGSAGTHKPFRNTPYILEIGTPALVDAALVKFDSSGTKLWGTYYGGGGNDWVRDMYYSADGCIYLLGQTGRSDTGIATPGTYQSVMASNINSTCNFLAKFNNNGQRLWGTYICAPGIIGCYGLTGDENGNIYVVGITTSTEDIATPGVYQEEIKGFRDIFIMKFNDEGQKLWGTYLGGNGVEELDEYLPSYTLSPYNFYGDNTGANSLVYLASEGALYVSGATTDTAGWEAECGYTLTHYGNSGFLAKMDTSGQLLWASLFESPLFDIAVVPQSDQGKNAIYFTGGTHFNGIATPGAHQETKSTNYAGMIGKFTEEYICTDTLSLVYAGGILSTNEGYNSYSWYHNGELILTDTIATLEVSDTSGYYYVMATKCGAVCQSSTFTFVPTTSITNYPENQNFYLLPNPAKDILTISSKEPLRNAHVEIYDISGRALHRSLMNGTSKVIDVSAYSSGMYLIKINGTKNIMTAKWVKE